MRRLPLLIIKAAPFTDGRPFLHGRLECENPKVHNEVAFFLNSSRQKSCVTSRIFTEAEYPKELRDARIFTTYPNWTGELEEYNIRFDRIEVVPYFVEDPLPCMLGMDFLSLCPLIEVEGQLLLEMRSRDVHVQ